MGLLADLSNSYSFLSPPFILYKLISVYILYIHFRYLVISDFTEGSKSMTSMDHHPSELLSGSTEKMDL